MNGRILPIGTQVFHREHPAIPATLLDEIDGSSQIQFLFPVRFRGNPLRRGAIWLCCNDNLFLSEDEAYKAAWRPREDQ